MTSRPITSISIKARRTELSDAQDALKFANHSTTDLFGILNEVGRVHELIEKSVLSITLEDEINGKVLALACFYDYPNISSIDPAEWEVWFSENYPDSKCNTLNTLFLHLFLSQSEYSVSSIQEIIRSTFKAVFECHYILLCVPISKVPDDALSSVFKLDMLRPTTSQPEYCVIFSTKRDKHIPVLHIRDASVNDNDDLIPLFNSYTDILKLTYGDFYVAEMIEAQNENNKCLAAEADGLAVGFMAITTDVNLELLNKCYELRSFHGLHKQNENDITRPSSTEIAQAVASGQKSANKRASMIQEAFVPEEARKLSTVAYDAIDADENELPRENLDENDTNNDLELNQTDINFLFEPTFHGESNAFAIQLFCIDEKFDSRSLDFLPKAFESLPDKDYCIITLPQTVPEFPLLQSFFRVTPRKTCVLNQELYLFHRAGLIKEFNVREAKHDDLDAIKYLIKNLKSKEQLVYDVEVFLKSRKIEYGVDFHVFVAEVFGQVVGVAVVKQEEDIEYLRSHYNIEDFIYYTHHKREEHGHLTRFALNPVFLYLTKHFIKEVLRKSHKTSIYYPIFPKYANPADLERYSLVTAMNFMVPVKYRDQIEFNFDKLGINAPSSQVLDSRYSFPVPFALNHINRKLLLEPKITINVRIVVVGASEVGLSFLETLAFSPHLRFNNLTLVSPRGLPGQLDYDLARDKMLMNSMNYNHTTHARLSLRSWVNVVYGKMTAIDRRNKNIIINTNKVLPYDHLIICTGQQYYPVAPYDLNVYNSYSREYTKSTFDKILFDAPPQNVFVVNDEYDGNDVLKYIEANNVVDKKNHIIFYGYNLDVFCAIQSLLSLNIEPSRIVIVHSNDQFKNESELNVFNNIHINKKIKEYLNDVQIKVYSGYFMKEWKNTGSNFVENILFQTIHEEDGKRQLQFNCDLLFCYHKKNVDYNTFIAANDSSLVFDGKIVIDNTFHTNDSCIRAAGTVTKFKRSYHVDPWTHECFNSKEVGKDLASRLLQLLDPTIIKDENENDSQRDVKENPLIQLYKTPKIVYANLPGSYYYLHICKPGLPSTVDEVKPENELGDEFVTNTENGYFRIHINQYKKVETVTCLSKQSFPARNYSRLYGLHERFLNNLALRFKDGLIKDFYDYFNDSWCVALFHDRFGDLCQEIRELLTTSNNGLKSVDQFLIDDIDSDLILSRNQRASLGDYFKSSGTKRVVELRLLKFLNYNYNLLPMYAKPDMV